MLNDNAALSGKGSISVVCCYNNAALYDRFTKTLNGAETPFVLVGIDNTGMQFSSCAKAFNDALKTIQTEYVIFAHQDIVFENAKMFDRFADQLYEINANDIIGVAGVCNGRKGVYSNIYRNFEKDFSGSIRVNGMCECDTVDECFFAGKTDFFKKEPFDEIICCGWHLYAADRCLNTKRNGQNVWVSDISLVHPSDGKINHSFVKTFLALGKKYNRDFSVIRTCCAECLTGKFGRLFSFLVIQCQRIKYSLM